jgi:hypothetical protein
LFAAGFRGLSKYTGTVLAVFLVQSIVAFGCMVGISIVLSSQLAQVPMFDEAVDGDLVAMLWVVRSARPSFVAVAGIICGAIVLWHLVSWFVVGGLVGVFAQKPEGRADTARCFGASGAATYILYVRLAVYSLPGLSVVASILVFAEPWLSKQLATALTLPQFFAPLALVLLPVALLLHFLWTVTDYARVELSLRHESHDPSVVKTYLRTVVWVVRRPITLVHAGIGWIAFLVVSIAYMYIAQGHPMYGAEGAIALFFVRQGVALLRMAIHAGVIAGQVELGRVRPLPPRRVEVKPDPKTA